MIHMIGLAQVLHQMLFLTQPTIEPKTSCMAGIHATTKPPGEALCDMFFIDRELLNTVHNQLSSKHFVRPSVKKKGFERFSMLQF